MPPADKRSKEEWHTPGPLAKYEEHHFQHFQDVGVAFNGNRIWVCVDGMSLLRAKVVDGKFYIEFTPPTAISKAEDPNA